MGSAMSVFRDQVADALRAVRVTSPTSYAWFGSPAPPLRRALRSALAPSAARQYLVARLEQELYRSFYLHGVPRPRSRHDALPNGPDPAFVTALSGANTSTAGWGGGWRVVDVAHADGAIVAERDGLRLRMDASDYLPAGDGPPAPRALVRARLPKELRAASPGYYVAFGDTAGATGSAVEVRVYFNLTHAGAVPLLAAATRLLNEQQIAFSLKLVNHPGRYFRCDAGVLYLDAGDFAAARSALRALVTACSPYLHAETPALTKPLTRGVGIGEHRSELGASFGIGRCRLIAEAIADAHEQRLTALEARVDVVVQRFALHDMDLDAPYLLSRARDDYVL
jgi:hypothetical protein